MGTIIGEAFVDDGEGRQSVGGAVVRVSGLGVEETTLAGSKFVLESIPLGVHEIIIEHVELGRAVRFKVEIETPFQTVILDDAVTTLARAATVRGRVVVENPVDVDVFLIGGDANDVARPGDDGSFVLVGVPSGPAQIAFSKDGFDLAVVDVALAEGDNDLDDIALIRTTVTDLPLAGSAQLVGAVDHRGVTIRLNDGADVATTEQTGAFAFAALSPGRYTLTASKPGFRTATLPTVALNSNGDVFGLVPIFLQPGEDPPPPVVEPVSVQIVAPTSGAALAAGAQSAFDATVKSADPTLLTWTIAVDGGAPTAVGTGTPLVVSLPTVDARAQLDIAASLPDGTSDSVTVFIDPIVVPVPTVDITSPTSGALLLSDSDTALDAIVTNANIATLTWTMTVAGNETAVGSGAPVIVTLPTVAARTQVDFTARLPDGTLDLVSVFVDPIVVPPTSVDIISPVSGGVFLSGDQAALDANVANASIATVAWTMSVGGAAPQALGTGAPLVVAMPTVSARTQVDVFARLPDGASDSATVFVDPIVVPPPVVAITAPGPGDIIPGATSIVLDADVDNASAAGLTWALRPFGDIDETALGTGAPILAVLPDVVSRASFEIIARLPDGTEDTVVIFVDPAVITSADPFVPGADALVAGVVQSPLLDDDGNVIGSRIVIQEGQPITVAPAPGLSAVFSDGNQAFNGSLPLRALPVGTHTFTATFTTATGQQGTSILEVEVQPLVFNIVIESPTADGTFFDDTAIPLRASITHGFQTGFLADAVTWRDQANAVIANGAVASVTLPAGPNVAALEVRDVIGNVRTAVVPVDVVTLTFTATFNAPANGSRVLEGTPLRINVGFSHNRLSAEERAAVFVHLISDRMGRLTDDAGADQFAPDSDVFISNLVEGRHVLTARVFAAGRIATATTTVNVDVPFVSSVLLSSADVLAVPGQPLAFEVTASGGNGAVPLVHWFLDGVEFDPAWAGYGVDPADPGRQQMDFGNYDPNAFPFTDPRWFEGPHIVEVWVRTADVDVNLGCIDQGVRAQCHAINLEVARAPIVITTNLNLTNPAAPEVWSGVVQLQAEVLINGGRLIIQPGTQILVDMRSVASPTTAVTAAEREIILQAGSLEMGVEDGSPITFETIKNFASTPRWNGFLQGAGTAARTLIAHNVTVRDTVAGLTLDNVDLVSGSRQLILDGFTVENSNQGIRIECATTLQNITLRNIASAAGAQLQLQHSSFCPSEERIDGLTIEAGQFGVFLFAAASPTITTITGADIQGNITRGILAQNNVHVVLEDSLISGNTNTTAGVAGLELDPGSSAEVYDSVFDNNANSVSLDDIGVLGFRAQNTRFTNTSKAIHVNGIATGRPIEVHASTFENAGIVMEWQNTGTNFIAEARFEGNFLGDPNQVGTVARTLAQTPAGTVPNVPRVTDVRDSLGAQLLGLTRVDNPLPTTSIPLAVILEPQHMHAYNGQTQCIPAVAFPRDRGFSVATGCTWRVGAPGASAAQSTAITPDSDGCLAGLADGEHSLHLVCNDGGGETVHSTRLLVDSTRYAGRIHPQGETWRGTVVVDGDVIVPVGTTLTIEPGTTIRVKDTDRMFSWRPRSVSNQLGNTRLRGFPTRVDFHVDGTVDALGTVDSRVIFEAETAVAPARWGGFTLGGGGPTIRLQHAIVRGADSVMASTSDLAPANSPVYDIVELDVEDSTFVFTGLCPDLTTNLDTLRNVAVADCGASGAVTFSGGNWLATRGGNVTAWLQLSTQTGGTLIQPRLENIVATGSSTSREIFFHANGNGVDSQLNGLDVTEVTNLASQNGNQRTFIDGSIVRRYGVALAANNGNSSLFISNSAFEDGTRLLQANINVFSMTASRVTRATNAISVIPRVFQVMSATGCQFESVPTVFNMNNDNTGGFEAATFNFSGNNYIGTTNRVVLLGGTVTANATTNINVQNSFWDTTDRDVILTLVQDPRTDADPNDDIEGRTNFTGFTAAPLVLTTP